MQIIKTRKLAKTVSFLIVCKVTCLVQLAETMLLLGNIEFRNAV